jgi:hypothetical protein
MKNNFIRIPKKLEFSSDLPKNIHRALSHFSCMFGSIALNSGIARIAFPVPGLPRELAPHV